MTPDSSPPAADLDYDVDYYRELYRFNIQMRHDDPERRTLAWRVRNRYLSDGACA